MKGLPVGNMVDKVLLEHKAPAFNDVEKCLLEWVCIYSKPVLKDVNSLNFFNFIIDLLIRVYLQRCPKNNINRLLC